MPSASDGASIDAAVAETGAAHGTAMGSVPAPPYAILYYSANEKYFLEKYKQYLLFYWRFIDDVFGIWNFCNDEAHAMWLSFQFDLTFGTLHWEVNEPSNCCVFLDIIISLQWNHINNNSRERTKLTLVHSS